MENAEKPSITLTIKDIMDLASYAGLNVTDEACDLDLETEFTITSGLVAVDDCRTQAYSGLYVFCTEYPEEGCLPLNENIVDCLVEAE